MDVCVTGGAGFIGAHIANALLARGETVCVVDDLSGGSLDNLEAPITFYEQDCADYRRMSALFQQHRPDVLVHCAANAREGASQFQPTSVTQRNMQAYVATLSAAIAAGVQRVVLFSSMAVYGDQAPPFSEDLSPRPVDVYAVNKAAMERITAILSGIYKFEYTIIRPHNVFGELQCLHDPFRNVVGIFMNRLLRGEPLFIYGDGRQTRAFSYIADSLPAFLAVVREDTDRFNGEIINIGGTHAVSVLDMADAVRREMGNPAAPITFLPDRPCEVKHAYTTYEKSVQLLGYKDVVGWEAGVAHMARWARTLGPQPWRTSDLLELRAACMPETWSDASFAYTAALGM